MSEPTDSSRPPQPRFSLAALFELIAGIALFFGLVIELGCAGFSIAFAATAIVLAAHYVTFARDRQQAWRHVGLGCVAFAMLGLVTMCCLAIPNAARNGSPSRDCRNNLRQLAMALEMYQNAHGHFPPPVVRDAQGKPMHSWRVLILPYLERNDIFEAYDFKEPWDGPNNSKLAAHMPGVFRCPSSPRGRGNLTSYFYVVGPGREKPGSPHLTARDFKDDPKVLLVESSTARVNWPEPRDLTIEEVIAEAKALATRGAASHHYHEDAIWRYGGGFHVAELDWKAQHRLPDDTDAELLRALLTIDGGEKVEFPRFTHREELRPEFFILISITAAFVLLAIARRVRLARTMKRMT